MKNFIKVTTSHDSQIQYVNIKKVLRIKEVRENTRLYLDKTNYIEVKETPPEILNQRNQK